MNEERKLEKAAEGKIEVKIVAFILLLFSIIFIVFDIILTKGFLDAKETLSTNAQTMVMVITYSVTLFSLIAAIIGLRGKNSKAIVIFGIIILVLGVAATFVGFIYTGKFNHAYIIVGLLGGVMTSGGLKLLSIIK